MSTMTAIDLSKLAAPDVVETLDYEVILSDLVTLTRSLFAAAEILPDWDPTLESDVIVKLLQTYAYREMTLRQRVNDGARAVMLAHAVGADLDNLAAFYGVARLLISAADPDTVPPTPAVHESDTRLRSRTQMALEGFSTAGPVGAYRYHALSASALVKDVSVTSPQPGDVLVTVLSTQGAGAPDSQLLALVTAALNDQDVRPLNDTVIVAPAAIIPYQITAHLVMFSGPDGATTAATAESAAAAYADSCHALGRKVTLSGLYAALQQTGVESVVLTSPVAPVLPGEGEAAHCTGITITWATADD